MTARLQPTSSTANTDRPKRGPQNFAGDDAGHSRDNVSLQPMRSDDDDETSPLRAEDEVSSQADGAAGPLP